MIETDTPVGTPVVAYPGFRPDNRVPTFATGAWTLTTTTRSLPWLLGGHTWVVLVDGHAGGIALTHVDPPGDRVRIQRRRTKGWRMPETAKYVGRPTKWGNPFKVGEIAPHRHRSAAHPHDFYIDHHMIVTARQAAGLYRKIVEDPAEHQYIGYRPPTVATIRAELAGYDLVCWCPLDQPCHGDVLLDLMRHSAPATAVTLP